MAARLDASRLDCLVCGRVFTFTPTKRTRHGSLSLSLSLPTHPPWPPDRASDHDRRPPLRFIIPLSNFSSPNGRDDATRLGKYFEWIDVISCSPLGGVKQKKKELIIFLNNEIKRCKVNLVTSSWI